MSHDIDDIAATHDVRIGPPPHDGKPCFVAHADGKPREFYHGTDHEAIQLPMVPSVRGNMGPGVYFAGTPEQAQAYGEHVYVARVALRNPWFLRLEYDSPEGLAMDFDSPSVAAVLALPGGRELAERARDSEDGMFDEELQAVLRRLGHDGVVGIYADGSCEVMAFRGDQVFVHWQHRFQDQQQVANQERPRA